ncbi:hypothetical protein CRE_18674 [Caenorhabditis remanei]|uniref:RING-type domain-containing protein n=1 Tax=Caenorhabditis remanei TaxID=31234 RepID=E3LKY7_CAERE|nr:hypothetical protein CRE_18674 [Caenorhabditis remanei]
MDVVNFENCRPEIFKRIIRHLITPEHIPKNWPSSGSNSLTSLQQLIDFSESLSTQYGNAENMMKSLWKYASFPGSASYFKIRKTEYYFQDTKYYRGFSEELYVYKKEYYLRLYDRVVDCPFSGFAGSLAYSLISYFLKIQEEKLANGSEMAAINMFLFAKVQFKIRDIGVKFVKGGWENLNEKKKLRFEYMSLEEIFDAFKNVLHQMEKEETEGNEVLEVLKGFNVVAPVKDNGKTYFKVYVWIKEVIEIFRTFIERNKFLMLPRSETIGTTGSVKAPVRLFQFENNKIVMAHELLHNMKVEQLDVSQFENKILALPRLDTLTFRKVFQMIPAECMKNVDFVKVDIECRLIFILLDTETLEFIPTEYNETTTNGVEDNKEADLVTLEKQEIVTTQGLDQELQKEKCEEVPKIEIDGKEKKEKKKNPSLKKKESADERESQTCPKCYRASTFTRKSNEKLRLANIENKQLKKKITEIEKDKDARIALLEKLVEDQKNELIEKDAAIQNLYIEKQKLEKDKEELEIHLSVRNDKVQALEVITSSESIEGFNKSKDESEKIRNVLFNLFDVREIIHREDPVSKCSELADLLITKTNNDLVRRNSKIEKTKFIKECNTFIKAVDNNLAMIRGRHQITVEEVPELPEFPILSKQFKDAYKKTMKSDIPNICKSLLKVKEIDSNELIDNECLICLQDMNPEEETIKCECKRRYHNGCIQQWLETKRTCPACSASLLDDNEFPPLS